MYYDKYEYDHSGDKRVANNGFNAMSPAMQKVYEEDVKRFYLEFSGEETVPEHIKEFGQIKLRDFRRSSGCAKDGVYTKGYTGSLKQQLFKQYADHTQQMIERANASQDKLLDVLDELFKFSYDQVEKKKHVIINPALNEKALQELINKTRKLIVELYLACEQDFVSGLKIYEAIVEKQVVDTSIAQLKSMNESLDVMGTAEPMAAAKPSAVAEEPAPEKQEPVITKPLAEPNKEQPKPMAEIGEKAKETTQAVLQETKDVTSAVGEKIGDLEGKLKNTL